MRQIVCVALILSLGGGCGGRSVGLADDAGPDARATRADGGLQIDARVARDGAVHPDRGPLPPDGSDFCQANGDCAPTEYCHMDSGCLPTGAKMGACRPRPQQCPSLLSPVCGCDGKVYPNDCVAHGSGVNVDYPGNCTTCLTLDAAYRAAVTQARQCCPMCNSIQCQVKVQDALLCPCPTFVNGALPELQQLQQIQQKFVTLGCMSESCALGCVPPNSATCVGRGSTGTCVDAY